jgi:hypothetical protein
MFRAFYDSPWQHPGIAFACGVPLLAIALLGIRAARRAHDADPRRRAFLLSFLVIELAILVDAFFTGAWSPLPPESTAAQAAAAVFVVLGDLRYFYFIERQRGEVAAGSRSALRAMTIALPVSLIVPVGTAVCRGLWPARLQGNFLYFVYELALLVVAVAFALARRPRVTDRADRRRAYVTRLLVLEVVQYATWAIADLLILAGEDIGYLVRVLPNAIYYAAFVPAACLRTPAGSRT